ncbi:MAG: hypothetical protein H7832_14780 [Magnetococcus sp. DMHC-6]
MPIEFDPSRFQNLPALAISDAAWLAAISPEAMARFVQEGVAAGVLSPRSLGRPVDLSISITELVQLGFALLGRKEAQLAMERLLHSSSAPKQNFSPAPLASPPPIEELPKADIRERTPQRKTVKISTIKEKSKKIEKPKAKAKEKVKVKKKK